MNIKKIISEISFRNLFECSYDESLMLLKIRNEREIRENSFTKHEISLKEHENWLKKNNEKKDSKNFVVLNKGRIIGNVNIYNPTNKPTLRFWSFYISKKERRVGVGFALEYKALNYIFDKLGLKLINCFVLNQNKEVIKLHKKFGFKELIKKESIIPKQFEKNTTHLFLNKENWLKVKKDFKNRFLILCN